MKNILAFILGFTGFLLLIGSAGDCEGACMDQANTLGEMFTLIVIGFGCLLVAYLLVEKEIK
jgi:hypothetical protein